MNRASWVIVAITFLIIAALGVLYLWPVAKSSWNIYQETNQTKKDLEDISKRKEVLTELTKNDKLSYLYNIASTYIPEESKSGELVIELTAMANQSNLKVEQVSLEQIEKTQKSNEETTDKKTETAGSSQKTSTTNVQETSSQEVDFSMKVSGTFADFLNFLKATETSSRLISITAMNLNQSNDQFIAQLNGKAYWKKGTDLEKNLTNIEISKETIAKFQNLKSYGTPIDLPTESGFGRPDPFAEF